MENYIPKDKCIGRRLYRIRSRNLAFGVFRPDGAGFLGIRTKFGSRYVFEEYHWDNGPPYGTVRPLEDLGIDLPDDILLTDNFPGSWDKAGTREVEFDSPVAKGGKGWTYKDTGEDANGEGGYMKPNEVLFGWLEQQEKEFRTMKITLDEKTAEVVSKAMLASGDKDSPLAAVVAGENELNTMSAKMLWFALQVCCDQQGTPDDAVEGSTESYFGTLKDHAPALNLLRNDLKAFAPGLDLMSDRTGLKDKLDDH